MSKEQIAAVVVVLGVLSAAIAQFYDLKSEVRELRVHVEYLSGKGWHSPAEGK